MQVKPAILAQCLALWEVPTSAVTNWVRIQTHYLRSLAPSFFIYFISIFNQLYINCFVVSLRRVGLNVQFVNSWELRIRTYFRVNKVNEVTYFFSL